MESEEDSCLSYESENQKELQLQFEKMLATCMDQEAMQNKDWMAYIATTNYEIESADDKSVKSAEFDPKFIAKRNERERVRVKAVNESFDNLRKLIPSLKFRNKRVSKVKTLKKALEYIRDLQKMLENNNFN